MHTTVLPNGAQGAFIQSNDVALERPHLFPMPFVSSAYVALVSRITGGSKNSTQRSAQAQAPRPDCLRQFLPPCQISDIEGLAHVSTQCCLDCIVGNREIGGTDGARNRLSAREYRHGGLDKLASRVARSGNLGAV